MARTQAADYEQRREAIVEKAAQLFARAGFRGTSVQDLATACATSKSLFYHYYPSKEDVLYAVMASHIDQLVLDVEEVMAGGGEPAELLSKMIHAFMRHYVGAADRQNVLLNELGNLPEDRRRIIVEKQRGVVDAVQSLLVRIHPSLAADPVRARVQTMLLFGMINWTKTWFRPEGPIDAEELADIVVANALRAEASP
ncbi:MAG: TetR/AcrR family transcriptional regulator [Sphingobium sp.]|uniref:TetR/AcrR family transcriptional regulator n=1 Tax=Sphingobium sp. TaxID=1912891 RepID=UPI002E23FDEE